MDGGSAWKAFKRETENALEQGVNVQLGMSLVAAGRLAQDRDLYRWTVIAATS